MIQPASRLDSIGLSLIRQINALATPLSVNLGIGEPNVEPDETLREMARRAAGSGSWHYTPNAGALSLRRKIVASSAGGFDPQTEVCITAGTQEGLFAIFQAYVELGDEVLIPDPGFLSYESVTRLCGGTPRGYRLDAPDWNIDFASLESLISDRTRIIVVNSPSNPTGGVLSTGELERVASLAEEAGAVVVSDEVYREIYFGPSPPPSLLGYRKNVIVVSGLSKSHSMTGLRLGWVIADKDLLAPIVKAHQYIATCASSFSQTLAEMIFEAREWDEDWLCRVRSQFLRQRDVAMSAAGKFLHAAIPPPGGAFYLFVPVPSCDSVTLARTLATDAAVLTIPGVAFGKAGEGFLRISFASSPGEIATGIERVARFLDGAKS